MVPKIERDRTTIPRTMPTLRTIRNPGISSAVVVIEISIISPYIGPNLQLIRPIHAKQANCDGTRSPGRFGRACATDDRFSLHGQDHGLPARPSHYDGDRLS